VLDAVAVEWPYCSHVRELPDRSELLVAPLLKERALGLFGSTDLI
jgi:hypothetical protein